MHISKADFRATVELINWKTTKPQQRTTQKVFKKKLKQKNHRTIRERYEIFRNVPYGEAFVSLNYFWSQLSRRVRLNIVHRNFVQLRYFSFDIISVNFISSLSCLFLDILRSLNNISKLEFLIKFLLFKWVIWIFQQKC